MFEKILFPTDFSDVSMKALPFIFSLKETGTRQVVVLRVISKKKIETFSLGASWVGKSVRECQEEAYQELEKDASRKMEMIKSELEGVGLKVKIRVERGNPYARILEMEKEEDVSVIVLGSHGRSNINEMLLGSVSDHVIRHSKKPVLVIKR